jgi:hypothetical protein
MTLTLFFLSCLSADICQAQLHDVLCRDGGGDFGAEFPTGIKVRVGPAKSGQLESRVCQATLSWADQELLVADAASQVDVDAFGVDLGVGAPVVAFQVKKSKAECCMEYKIYTMRAPPVLLRTITGGGFFSAADTDLDGRIEIWTDDASSVEGFENLRLSDLDFPPPIVLRFARGRLLDANSEFQPYFDKKIVEVRGKLNPQDLADFKNSDGVLLSTSVIPAVRLVQLRKVKLKVLEIIWAYLYSGREQEAWRSLAEMWPTSDLDRIRGALSNARARGLLSQVDGISTPVRPGHENHVKIFDGTIVVTATPGVTPKGVKPKQEITPPRAILMERPPPATPVEIELAQTESTLKLVIDSAGKVRSAEVVGGAQQVDEGLLKSTSDWKFVPAFMEGQPVASQIFLGVSLKR